SGGQGQQVDRLAATLAERGAERSASVAAKQEGGRGGEGQPAIDHSPAPPYHPVHRRSPQGKPPGGTRMKAEKRKALETNVLADKLGKAVEGLKQGPSRRTLVYVGIAVLALLVYFTWRYFSTSSEKGSSERWFKLDQAVFPAQLD